MATEQIECAVEKLADEVADVGVDDTIVSDTDSDDEALKQNQLLPMSGPPIEPTYEPETADELAGGKARQVLVLLELRAEGVDRVHHQRTLHAHRRAVGRVNHLHLARDQAV